MEEGKIEYNPRFFKAEDYSEDSSDSSSSDSSESQTSSDEESKDIERLNDEMKQMEINGIKLYINIILFLLSISHKTITLVLIT